MMLSSHIGNTVQDLKAILDKGFEALQAEHDKLLSNAAQEMPKIQKIESANPFGWSANDWVNKLERDLTSRSSYGPDIKPSPEKMETEGNKKLDEMKAGAQAIHANNLPKLQSNKFLSEKLKFVMKNIGFPDSYSVTERVRGRDKSIPRQAGYLDDINRNIVLTDGFDRMESFYQQHKTVLKDYVAKRRYEDSQVERKKEEEKKKIEANRLLGVWLGKLNLPSTAGWEDILESVLKKDKYLYLAHYLSKNRGDWSDGTHYAKIGLSQFTNEDETDASIYSEISGYISDWDGDGRIFRDCKWNYAVLFGMVSSEVAKEYNELMAVMPNDNP